MLKHKTVAEPQIYNGILSMKVKASLNVNRRRLERNRRDADRYENEGYKVERDLHSNGAYVAIIGDTHGEDEKKAARILAENGISVTLDREGQMIKLPNGQRYKIPTPDGHIYGHSHEMYVFRGRPDPRTVAEAIKHSYKAFRPDSRRNIQSEIAISMAPVGSGYKSHHIAEGVREHKRRVRAGETPAKPRIYLHIDEGRRSVYYWSIK